MAKVVGTKCRRNIAENLNRLSRAHERYRRQTDGRAIAYSEREREFTFAKKRRCSNVRQSMKTGFMFRVPVTRCWKFCLSRDKERFFAASQYWVAQLK